MAPIAIVAAAVGHLEVTVLQSGSDGELFTYGFFGIGALVGVWWIGRGLKHVVRSRRVARRDPVPTGRVATESGTVEVEGTAETLSEIVSAHGTGEACLAYEYSNPGAGGPYDREGQYERERDSVPFLVSDDAGAVVVDPPGATLTLDDDSMHERRLAPGDTVHVVGTVTDDRPDVADADADVNGVLQATHVTDSAEARAAERMYAGGVKEVLAGLVVIAFVGGLLWNTGYL